MSTPPRTGLWAVLPNSLRAAFIAALVFSVASGGLLFRAPTSSQTASEMSGDGAVARPGLDADDEPETTITPVPQPGRSRSEAVLTAPEDDNETVVGPPGSGYPTFANYIYDVDGYEQTPFGRNDLPAEMTMRVDRQPAIGSSGPAPEPNELVYDLFFAEDHQEHMVVAYTREGIAFSYGSAMNTVGPVEHSSAATYDPPILQIPAVLEEGMTREGSSTATDDGGTQTRSDDWTVTVTGRQAIEVLGEDVEAWVVSVERRSRPGSQEQTQRTRRYWLDPQRNIWVKWEETTTGTEEFGPSTVTYTVQYEATLSGIEPL